MTTSREQESSVESQKYDDFRIQIITDSNCNLACDYCVLLYKNQAYKEERAISQHVMDAYIDFFSKNYEDILKHYRRITITFFGGEPLLSFERVVYFMEKLKGFEKINFVIHTNGVLLSQKIINQLASFPKDRYSFIVSIDGDVDLMLKYRLKAKQQFYRIILWIWLLRKNNIRFLVSPSIMKPEGVELFKNYAYLYALKPDWIIINPVTAIYRYREAESSKEIVKGVKMFLDYLRIKEGLTDEQIIAFFWLPLTPGDFRNYLKFGINITWDIDGTIHAMSFAWQWFDDGGTYTKEDLKGITLGNVLFNVQQLKNSICRTGLYKDENLWKIAYRQQRKWTLPDWDVQNMLASMILRYFRDFYSQSITRKRLCQ